MVVANPRRAERAESRMAAGSLATLSIPDFFSRAWLDEWWSRVVGAVTMLCYVTATSCHTAKHLWEKYYGDIEA